MRAAESAVVLYGPPAAGKDTVTTALTAADPRFQLYRRLKVGAGRTTGYRMASAQDLAELDAAGAVIYSNHRYDSTYVIDQRELDAMLKQGDIPVVHVGQPEAVDALLSAAPAIHWSVIELWCPRRVAAERIEARATADTAQRLSAWDATPHLAVADRRIDTSLVGAGTAARQIIDAVAEAACTVVVPVFHLVRDDGDLDLTATRSYAAAAATGWTDYFLLNGSTTSGQTLSDTDRTAILDIWLEEVPPDQILACSWSSDDLQAAAERGVTPMAVMDAPNYSAAKRFLEGLPAGAAIYSHPELFGNYGFTAALARWAAGAGHLPIGGKLAKIQPDEIAEIHRAAMEFDLWDGSARHLRQSMAAGAAGTVATPLAARLADLPPRSLAAIQSAVDAVYVELDRLSSREAKREWFIRRA